MKIKKSIISRETIESIQELLREDTRPEIRASFEEAHISYSGERADQIHRDCKAKLIRIDKALNSLAMLKPFCR